MARRIADEPAFVLHRYDWSESSLILEVLTRHHGRIAVVAKGAKKPSSNFRPVLLPLQPLHLAFGGDAEIRTLKSAEWVGGHVMPSGEALLSGYYLNELLLRHQHWAEVGAGALGALGHQRQPSVVAGERLDDQAGFAPVVAVQDEGRLVRDPSTRSQSCEPALRRRPSRRAP